MSKPLLSVIKQEFNFAGGEKDLYAGPPPDKAKEVLTHRSCSRVYGPAHTHSICTQRMIVIYSDQRTEDTNVTR